MGNKLLAIRDIQAEYHMGRDLARRLCQLLPHTYIGKQRLVVLQSDLEALLRVATHARIDMWVVANMSAETFSTWYASNHATFENRTESHDAG